MSDQVVLSKHDMKIAVTRAIIAQLERLDAGITLTALRLMLAGYEKDDARGH